MSRKPNYLGQEHVGLEEPAGGGWIVSYADMMTIILTFFILLLSISTIAQTKYELIVQAFTGQKAGNLQEVKKEIDRIVEEQQLGGEISTKLDMDGLTIEFSNALLFRSGEAVLKTGAEAAFGPIETHLSTKLLPEYGLVIEGYTDDVPISNERFKSNWELSTARAIHVMERLQRAGLDARRMSVQGFANTRPATEADISSSTVIEALEEPERKKAREANRRVIIRIDKLAPGVFKRIQRDQHPKTPAAGEAVKGGAKDGAKERVKGSTGKGATNGRPVKVDELAPFELPKREKKSK